MTIINRHQPDRPRIAPNGDILRYRTFPVLGKRKHYPPICKPTSRIIQCRLYRDVRQGNFVNHAPVTETFDYYFHGEPGISRVNFGATILNSTIYEARKLKNSKSLPKPLVIYSFHNLLDLQYGLEWQICTWLRHFINHMMPDNEVVGQEKMEEELDLLANAPEDEYREVYENNFNEFKMSEPDWAVICDGKWEDVPEVKIDRISPPTKPRSVYE
jgi:hypothetical protein